MTSPDFILGENYAVGDRKLSYDYPGEQCCVCRHRFPSGERVYDPKYTVLRDEEAGCGDYELEELHLFGGFVDAYCCKLLKYHELGAIAQRDWHAVWGALQRRNEGAGRRCKIWQWRDWTTNLEGERFASPFIYMLMAWHLTFTGLAVSDSVRPKCVSHAINKALKQEARRKSKKVRRSQKTRTCKLPMDIFWMICDYLPYQTVISAEKATGLCCGNKFWRSRISAKFFHEIRDIGDDDLDWGHLCIKLGEEYHKSPALYERRYILTCLDEALSFVKT
ncbi:hypothetical protein DTO207G8_6383 [Paecilomyces variotii]|nr:hypothetical protein DTO207G8_6383 [Paecilomyces variotii]KAJ9288680.1 hypothetical protein DTO021C3_3709 [Paecilomyces variotii]